MNQHGAINTIANCWSLPSWVFNNYTRWWSMINHNESVVPHTSLLKLQKARTSLSRVPRFSLHISRLQICVQLSSATLPSRKRHMQHQNSEIIWCLEIFRMIIVFLEWSSTFNHGSLGDRWRRPPKTALPGRRIQFWLRTCVFLDDFYHPVCDWNSPFFIGKTSTARHAAMSD